MISISNNPGAHSFNRRNQGRAIEATVPAQSTPQSTRLLRSHHPVGRLAVASLLLVLYVPVADVLPLSAGIDAIPEPVAVGIEEPVKRAGPRQRAW